MAYLPPFPDIYFDDDYEPTARKYGIATFFPIAYGFHCEECGKIQGFDIEKGLPSICLCDECKKNNEIMAWHT